jgi:hypothetical protein
LAVAFGDPQLLRSSAESEPRHMSQKSLQDANAGVIQSARDHAVDDPERIGNAHAPR